MLLVKYLWVHGNSKFKDTPSRKQGGVVLHHIAFYWSELYFNNAHTVVRLDYCTAFAPGEAKRFDVPFTYTFGDNRAGTEGATTSFFGYTVSPIPEPETYAMFLAGLGLMAVMARRRKA